jgi:hypothetical protein
VTDGEQLTAIDKSPMNRRLAVLLAMAMFVLVVDTSIMNVSISSVVRDLETTVSGVQSAIALEALVSAAFILIGSKVGDLIGRKRAYVLGLLGYAIGATAMTLAQTLLRSSSSGPSSVASVHRCCFRRCNHSFMETSREQTKSGSMHSSGQLRPSRLQSDPCWVGSLRHISRGESLSAGGSDHRHRAFRHQAGS